MAVARWWSARNRGARTVVMLPDQGDRYLDTVYNDAWLHAEPQRRLCAESGPAEVTRPAGETDWTWMRWGNRRLAEALGEALGERVAGR